MPNSSHVVRDLVQAGRLRIAYDRLGRHWNREMEVDLVAMREGELLLVVVRRLV